MSDIDPKNKQQLETQSGRMLLQQEQERERREFDCVFMQPGLVKRADQEDSNWLIPASTIAAAETLFDARPVYLDHPELFGFGWRQSPKVEKLAGVTFNPRWDADSEEMQGGIRFYDTDIGNLCIAIFDQMLADAAAGLEVPPTGLSAVLFHVSEFDMEEGIRVSKEFTYIESMDVVYAAGAGGFVRAALATLGQEIPDRFKINLGSIKHRDTGGSKMNDKDKKKEGQENLAPPAVDPDPVATIQQLSSQVAEISAQIAALATPPPTKEPDANQDRLDTISKDLARLTKIVAKQAEDTTIEGAGDQTLRPGHTGLEQVSLAVEAMLSGTRPPDNIAPLSGIREFYHLLSGDWEMTGLFHEDRVYLANVDSSTMAKLTADALNKRVMNEFQVYPRWWEAITSPEDFASLQTVKWITLGGIGELPTVGEGAAYTEVSWDDIQQQDDFVKKGGYIGLTIEAIDKDDTRRLQSAPRAIAQASWLTLSKSVSAIFTANGGVGPNIYYNDSDTRALFHTSNGNLGTSAFSWAAWVATRTAMRKQTEHNSGERLGALTAPRYALVSSDNEMLAIQTLASAGEPGTTDNDINPEAQGEGREERLRRARQRVIVVDLWTDTDDWAAVADPMLYPSIGIGYRFGRTPEIFSVASPTAGLMFTNDVMPIKARFFYAVGPVDWRGLYKHNKS